ncbi:IS3 family transposase [Paenibacillus anaericanus]|uniref:IS3 family transposase n=1 Tax=Paenibacillus anaericanus TaxID=170367 RepID=A0A3S1BY70_9BACL|nr:IS3 family transposase [Paenibacillus anaericanus]RUT37258.1 IS3 family transposase [Paenibacillus anaericanus]
MEVATHWIEQGYPIQRVLRLCGIPRSTYYYRLQHPEHQQPVSSGRPIPGYSFDKDGKQVVDARIRGYLRRLIQGPNSAFGYRKLTTLLRRKYKLIINKKKVYRLCKEMGILHPQRELTNPVPKRLANNRVVDGPNQLWQMDIKYGYVAGKRQHFYLASIIDVFDRNIVAHHRGKVCSTQDILRTVQKALLKRRIHEQEHKLVIRTDNGPQFISKAFYTFCEQTGIEHERIPNQTPNKNAFIESYHSIIERECYQRNCFENYEEAFAEVDRFIRYYNTERIHGSLKDWPPKEYLRLMTMGLIPPQKIAL